MYLEILPTPVIHKINGSPPESSAQAGDQKNTHPQKLVYRTEETYPRPTDTQLTPDPT